MNDLGRKGWLAALLLAAATAVAVGVTAYQAGVARGLSAQPQVVAAPPAPGTAQGTPTPYPYPPYRIYRPRFGVFGGLFGILMWILVFRLIFGGLFGWRRRYWHGRYGLDPYDFDDWHRRAHDRMRGDAGSAPQTPA